AVKDVQEIRAELHIDLFSDLSPLENRDVFVQVSRSPKIPRVHPRAVAEGEISSGREGSEVKPGAVVHGVLRSTRWSSWGACRSRAARGPSRIGESAAPSEINRDI